MKLKTNVIINETKQTFVKEISNVDLHKHRNIGQYLAQKYQYFFSIFRAKIVSLYLLSSLINEKKNDAYSQGSQFCGGTFLIALKYAKPDISTPV